MFEIKVIVKELGKAVSVEVDPNFKLSSIVEAVVDALPELKGKTSAVRLGDSKFGKRKFDLTVEELGIKEGDRLELIRKS